jgi:hypothetical protein
VTDRLSVRPVRVGLELVAALARLFPGQLELGRTAILFGAAQQLARAMAGEQTEAIAREWVEGESTWRALRDRYLLYR